MYARLSASGTFALLVTCTLFWCMQALVSVHWSPLPTSDGFSVDIVRLEKKPFEPDPRPTRPPLPETPPPMPRPTAQQQLDPDALAVPAPLPVGPADDTDALVGGIDRSAVQRWRYDPKVEDGRDVAQPGMRVTLEFSLGD